jgi:methylenetetrahydrofolate dehydrogenase (NADP+)/methenyltetrahydrofolate cyclohydrolase
MILDGKVVAKKIQEDIKKRVLENKIALTIVAIGNNNSANSYIRGVIRTSEKLGVTVNIVKLDENISTKEAIDEINKLNNDSLVNGIMIQMPLPKSIDQSKVINSISYLKDIDGLTDINMGKLIKKTNDGFIPCTPLAIIRLLEFYNIEVEGLDVVVVGRSNIVGKPIAGILTNKGATVTICHSKTRNLKEKIKNTDIVIVAIGQKNFLTKDMVSENAIVIDVGINVVNKKLYGDTDYDNLINKVKAITPVPGGIGAITNTLLIQNTVDSFFR